MPLDTSYSPRVEFLVPMIYIVTKDSASVNITLALRFMVEQQWHFGLLSRIAFYYWKMKDWGIKIIKAVFKTSLN